jgi:16S rRNA (adenine1518-N6/adenine1519-N6)-dimethyltransferase
LHVDLYDEPAVPLPDEKKFFRVIRACFSGKRKQLHNTLKSNLKLSDEEITRILGVAGVPPTIRPQELTLEQWATVVSEIQ